MSEDKNEVQKSISFETIVDTLPEAWAFIMDAIEQVGPNPTVHIHPASNAPPAILQQLFGDAMQVPPVERKFHVAVEGIVTIPRKELSVL